MIEIDMVGRGGDGGRREGRRKKGGTEGEGGDGGRREQETMKGFLRWAWEAAAERVGRKNLLATEQTDVECSDETQS